MRRWTRFAGTIGLLSLAWGPVQASAQVAPARTAQQSESLEEELPRAPVEIDGVVLFPVYGTTAFPAEARADAIAARIRALAKDPAFSPEALHRVDIDIGTQILGGQVNVMTATETDARLEGLTRDEFAEACVRRIQQAIEEFRAARSPKRLLKAGLLALACTAATAAIAAFFFFLMRRLRSALERRLQERIEAVRIQSFELVRAERIQRGLRSIPRALTAVGIAVLVLAYLQIVLGLFPWTRHVARRLGGWIVAPLQEMTDAVLAKIPDLIFLAILFLVVRILLKALRLFFEAVGRKEVVFEKFDPEWAEPTFKLVRLAVIAFAAVVAYPYIPGSSSEAFKGVSIFLGIVFSLGSSSAISNVIAGYTMTYRRAFRVGDRVRIGSVVGDVLQIRLQVTHLRTPKNEEVIVPNSTILNSEVVNYSTFARSPGLILHTKVGIGYETPWRQVEALLRLAAERTPGVEKDPPPFVLQEELGDFAVTYELNAYCHDALAMLAVSTALRRSILDLFNEYGVQIMTPAYEMDPGRPKTVPKDQWYAAPAAPEPPSDSKG